MDINEVGHSPVRGKPETSGAKRRRADLKSQTTWGDSVEISQEAIAVRHIAELSERIRELPEVDPERVRLAKEAVASGELLTSHAAKETAKGLLDALQ